MVEGFVGRASHQITGYAEFGYTKLSLALSCYGAIVIHPATYILILPSPPVAPSIEPGNDNTSTRLPRPGHGLPLDDWLELDRCGSAGRPGPC